MFVSPTEPKVFPDTLGWAVSPLPESYGVDFLWNSQLGLVGIQRKEFPGDFLSSIYDGRLGHEWIGKTAQLNLSILLLEGRPQWTSDGNLVHSNRGKVQWTKSQQRRFLASVQSQGIQVHWVADKYETVEFIIDIQQWTAKDHHNSLLSRPTPNGEWGVVTTRAYQRHLLMSLPRVGPVIADAILDHVGLPFALTVTEERLMEVPGVGPGIAGGIVKVFREVKSGTGW